MEKAQDLANAEVNAARMSVLVKNKEIVIAEKAQQKRRLEHTQQIKGLSKEERQLIA